MHEWLFGRLKTREAQSMKVRYIYFYLGQKGKVRLSPVMKVDELDDQMDG